MTITREAVGAPVDLTPEQRAIVEAPDGPVVVIAGAGTGKTRVIVERVRWLLETKGGLPPRVAPRPASEVTPVPDDNRDIDAAGVMTSLMGGPGARDAAGVITTGTAVARASTFPPAAEPMPRHGNPFDGPLVPEQLLVLTYNVKAAKELQDRLDAAIGPAVRARMTVSNFHSFCQHVLTESSADAGLPPRPDVLDGVGQLLLLMGLRDQLHLVYHGGGDWAFNGFVQFINRAKDELVTPDDFDAFVDQERSQFEFRFGGYEDAVIRLNAQGNLRPIRDVRSAYSGLRARERALASGRDPGDLNPGAAHWVAEREARRHVIGTGGLEDRRWLDEDQLDRVDTLAESYVIDGAALEVLRYEELARVYHAYEAELARRGALDFGEQIALVTRLFKTRPNVLRRWQRQFRYLLVDEFQDANVAQIELIELLGRTPDRPDNVMVVGDDDQSIYRFRGASFAAFAEFDARFSRPPAHDRAAPAPGSPTRLRIDQNFRSIGSVLDAANRLIVRNTTRFAPDKQLWTRKQAGIPVELHVCAGPEDEAVAIVDTIKALAGPGTGRRWNDVAVLYRKHKHRDAIVARLRDEDIPYTVVGGLSLFEAPEIRDLEQGLRAIADPHDDAALVRMMTAGPWRLDALEILRVARDARYDGARLIDAAGRMVAAGEEHEDVVDGASNGDRAAEPTSRVAAVDAATRAKLRALLGAIGELNPLTWREGPFTILERYLERTGAILDLLAAGTLEAKRSVVNIASFMRFASEWQAENPQRSLADFVGYLDAYKAAGGELPTSVELTEDVDGVRLMTLYQAKGLEYPVVIVPNLLAGEWPVKEQSAGWFPRELLREQVPGGDLHMDEERRLLYVAMTRAQERLFLMTHGPGAAKAQSQFVAELVEGAGADLVSVDRTAVAAGGELDGADGAGEDPGVDFDLLDHEDTPDDDAAIAAALAAARRVMPLPTARERRLALRLRASELVGLLEGTAEADPEATGAREVFRDRLAHVGRSATIAADEARAAGLDPLTFRVLALDSGSGANLLQVAPLPPTFSYSSLSKYEACPLQYAFSYVYRIPEPDKPRGPLTFGSTAHRAFEAFTKERRERIARGEPAPTREDLTRHFQANWEPTAFGDRTTEEGFQRRVGTLLDNFWTGELDSRSQVLHEELSFTLVLETADGTPPVRVYGEIDRIDRLPSGGIEVVDYKTGRVTSQKHVDDNLQLSIYALACRDALGLGTPEQVTLYFTESAIRQSTTRTDEQLDLAREELLARAHVIRSGDFTANPGKPCAWCDYRAMCPERL